MILSASRRTDIPGCYPAWFMNRLREGYVLTRNPINPRHVSRIDLSPKTVDCVVFWTKNAMPLMKYLDELERMGYPYMFQYTLTPYGPEIEENVPDKEAILANILQLSERVGKQRIVWRYDPILVNEEYTIERHAAAFEKLCALLHASVDRVVISFIDLYRKNKKYGLRALSPEEVARLAASLGRIAEKSELPIQTCCEEYDLREFGIAKGACIDAELLERVCGRPLGLRKSTGQRKGCLCAESVDIGAYHTCLNRCVYCYATDFKRLERKRTLYDEKSPILCDRIDVERDVVKTRKMRGL